LLEKYAWYVTNSQNRTWPVGSKKPNDLGFFDLLGNVYSRCQERLKDYPQGQGESVSVDEEDTLLVNAQDSRVLRGGSFASHASYNRCANRYWYVPSSRYNYVGFRPARTIIR
jgi:formylglycine-generating enzyme required for sulfatase activity